MDHIHEERTILARQYEATRNLQDYEKAVLLFEQAIQQDSTCVDDLFWLGFLHELRSRQLAAAAEALYERAARHAREQKHEEYYKILAHLTRVQIRTQKAHEAIEFAKKLIADQPEDVRLYCLLCNCYLSSNQQQDAQKAIDAARKLEPQNAYVLFFAGLAAEANGRYDEALDFWRLSIQHNDDLLDNLYSIAFLQENLGRLEEAMETWRQVVTWFRNHGYEAEVEARDPEQRIAQLTEKLARQGS